MNWRDRLRAAHREHIRRKYPNFYIASGGDKMKTRTWSDTTANGLTRAITDWIDLHGGFSSRINNTGMMRGGRWTKGTSKKGITDVMGTMCGRSLHIEVKIGRDRQSDAQKKVQERVVASGGLYFIAKDMESFVAWWDENFVETGVV